VTLAITTERLVLRRYTQHDAQDVLEFASQPSVAGATPEIEATEEGIRRYIDLQNSYQPFEKGKAFDLAIERKRDGKVMGLLTLICREHRQGSIGWALGTEYRRQGYATEAAKALMSYAFRSLGLHRIQADTNSGNSDSWGVMERLGMRREGQLREAVHREGKWLDRHIYGILSHEWRDAEAAG
jgi:RimJ/RimL family protein N-acetyltransferase